MLWATNKGTMGPCREVRFQILVWLIICPQRLEANKELLMSFSAMSDNVFRGPPGKHYGELGSAVPMAIEAIKNEPNILPNHTLNYFLTPTDCSEKKALATLADIRNNVSVVIGPACSSAIRGVGLLASYWNIPVVGYFGTGAILSNKLVYDTFVRVVSPGDRTSEIMLVILKKFGWKRAGLHKMGRYGSPYHTYTGLLAKKPENFTYVDPYFGNTNDWNYLRRASLLKISAESRVILLLANTFELPNTMLTAYDLGLCNSNEYVFISMDAEGSETFEWMWTGDPQKDAKLRIAYRSLIHITKIPYFLGEAYTNFLMEVRQRLLEPPFNSNLSSISEVSRSAGFVYDAVILYALTADLMIKQGMDPTNGREFTKQAKNVNFQGKTGAVSVNENGDRNDDYAIYDYRDGTLKKVAFYDGFKHEYITLEKILWGRDNVDEVPRDTPLCGFQGELCVADEKSDLTVMIVGATLGLLLILLLGLGIFFYRKNQFEAELSSANWKVEWNDINFNIETRTRQSALSIGSKNSHQTIALASPNVAIYKNETVYVKKINRPSIDWKKRSILLELKLIRDARHENLSSFMGACVESGNIAVLTRHCPKGGLEDLLENADIQLDLMFRISIAMDIISGLRYLHKSDIKFHGNLKSSNCLVDSRWTIKLTDFGLHEFTKPDGNTEIEEFPKYKALLWTAPEHLHEPSLGSLKGDIFSFGIVLQEIALRAGPYSENGDLAPKDIVDRVKKGSDQPFRPVVPKDSCSPIMQALMAKCWAENPSQRPDLGEIISDLKLLNGGKTINIMDNMVSMLEKYASNLEDIVANRTTLLMEEKKKTEMLLHQMLPKPVAEALKAGETIVPETFENVTIFFSDIVGFTSLSAESTPIQVVNLLNDLYTLFDSILEEYDVYKVETIGDAYMVVSGLPIRNGDQHAGEIATVSLHLLSSVLSFKIRHRPEIKLKLRIGIHTGSCVAGVVGLKMPRYCLFGDTVNTASRMESNGQALEVHVSGITRELLLKLGGYTLVERGQIEMKGKGKQTTYWLRGKINFDKPLPEWSSA